MREKHRASSSAKPFSRFNCDSVEYEFTASLEKFKLAEFKKEISRLTGESSSAATSVVGGVSTRNPRIADYHIHFRIRWPRQTLRASIEYVKGTSEPKPEDKGPFTEDFMAWLGRFFKNQMVNSDVSASFTYSTKNSQLVLPIPMRLPVRGQEVEILGMVAGIPAKPKGVYASFVAVDDGEITVSIDAERRVDFKHFSLHKDLLALSSVAKMFTRKTAR